MNKATFKRLRFLPGTALAVLTALLLWGGAAHAQRSVQTYRNAQTAHAIRDRKVDPKLSPVARARAQKLAAVKKKHDAQKFIDGVVQGEQAAASGTKEKGVVK
jgi:hypothetical protein